MTLTMMKYFITVAEECSISKAASRLFVSQPSLSHAIAQIEQEYHCKCFERLQNGLVITAKGRIILEYARSIMNLYQRMETDIQDSIENGEKSISIATITNHGNYFFPQTFYHIKELYPDISISFTEETKNDLEKGLLDGTYDVAVMRLPIKSQNLKFTVLGSEPVILMMNPKNRFVDRGYHVDGFEYPFIDIRLLMDETFLVFPHYDNVAYAINTIYANAGFFPKKYLEVQSIEVHEQLIAKNDYVSITPKPIWNPIGKNPNVAYFNIEPSYAIPYTLAVATANKPIPRHVQDYVNLIVRFNSFAERE